MSDSPRNLPDGEARRRAVAGEGCVVVQAPAGSGKTTLLAQRYLRLLAAVDAPERILALTFTRRAAQEMRERVVHALRCASGPAAPPGVNATTFELAVAAKRHMDAQSIDIDQHPSRLRIETIDAFNGWLSVQLPVAAGAGARLNLIENPKPLYAEAAQRALCYEAADAFGGAVERLLARNDQRWGQLAESLAGMLPSRDRWLPLIVGSLGAASALDVGQLARMRCRFDEDLAFLVRRTLRDAQRTLGKERIAALAPLLTAAARRLGTEQAQFAAWQLADEALEPEVEHVGRWRALAAFLLTQDGQLRKRVSKSQGFPASCAEKAPMLALLEEFDRDLACARVLGKLRALPHPAYSDEDWVRVRDAAQVLVLAAVELDEVFRKHGGVDFTAVSIAALRALGTAGAPTDLNLRLDYRLKHILVDEFQDTSSSQLELIRRLTAGWQRGDGRSVFCVGDPMQSIYGFRDAEVRAFLGLAEEGIGELRFRAEALSSNFRSDRAVVEWINRCFARVMPVVDDRDRGAIAYRPSESALAPAPAGVRPGVSVRSFVSRDEEARGVAELIESRRREHPAWRIAVLVRAKAHAREIAYRLRSRSIPFRALDIEPLAGRSAVRDLIMLTRALLHLGDRTAWLAVLRAPWSGLTLPDLLIVARSAPLVWDAVRDESVLERLSADGGARGRRVRGVLELAFRVQSEGSVTRWIERTWLALGAAACAMSELELRQVSAVFARLRELEGQGLPDAADLASSFDELCAQEAAPSAVEIMTIHKAKGLEFDMVVLPGLNRYTRSNTEQLMLAHQFAQSGRDGLVMAARPPIGAPKDRLFEFLRQQAREAATLEAERLLYVACTRAQWQLHLTAATEQEEEPEEEGGAASEEPPEGRAWRPRAGSLLAVLWPIVREEFLLKGERPPPQPLPDTLRGGPLTRVPADWSPNTLGAAPPLVDSSSVAARDETPVFDWAGETARRVGSLVHAELQEMDIARAEESAIRARGAHFRRWLQLHGVPEDRLEEASERAMKALLGVCQDPRGRWILEPRGGADLREFALSGHRQGEIVRAVFDRSFIDEAGIRWVIDYKTSQHTGGDREAFLDREVERYRPQLERYASLAQRLGPQPVRVGLYFPLMQAWREWVPGGP